MGIGDQLLTAPSWLRDRFQLPRFSTFGLMIVGALIAFELFNYSTTEFAFADLLGDLRFAGIRWATILALAFCGMDFAGIARLFTPDRHENDSFGVWYLLGAWFLAATMNAMLTWWSVSLALLQHEGLGNEILGRESLLGAVPVFVAVLVWLIRVLMIGTFTLMGARLVSRRVQAQAARAHKSSTAAKSASQQVEGYDRSSEHARGRNGRQPSTAVAGPTRRSS
jgi:hypothetical protein